MNSIVIPSEDDFKRWIKEAIEEYLDSGVSKPSITNHNEEELLNRVETAKMLRISLVTLTDWVKRGLPSHKQRGRVYFTKTEVMQYIKQNKLKHCIRSSII